MARVYFLLGHPILQQSATYSVAKIGPSDRLAGTAARRIRTNRPDSHFCIKYIYGIGRSSPARLIVYPAG